MIAKRSEENPILVPDSKSAWEAEAVFNGCPAKVGKNFHLLYRAQSLPIFVSGNTLSMSSIGCASGNDGVHFKNRRQFIKPEQEWERFGCEDPRVTRFNGKYYIFYTALSRFPFCADGIRVGLAITKDFKKMEAKHQVTPFNSKAMALFPERINGKMAAVLTANTDKPPAKIALAFFEKEEDIWSPPYWKAWYEKLDSYSLTLARSALDHVEIGAPPIKTKYGWLIFFSYIKNYFSPPAVFGVEAALLDLKNPFKILGRIETSLLIPEEEYEKYGRVPNIVFPSGALVKGKKLYLYYGAADTVVSLAELNLKDVLSEMLSEKLRKIEMVRSPSNPILELRAEHSWEAKAVFNPGAIYLSQRVRLIYRAMSPDNTSVFGYASSRDGFKFDERISEPIYVPRENFEKKNVQGANSGCEDPRLTIIGNIIYMCYTAFDGQGPARVALTSIRVSDFLPQKWNLAKPVLISLPDIDDKDAAIFPEKIKGKYAILHRLGNDIWLDYADSLDFDGKTWLKGDIIMRPRPGEFDSRKIGIAGPPIKTEVGWLLLYHGISKKENRHYHLRAALLDYNEDRKVIARTKYTIIEPEFPYEKEGQTPNVIFSCGALILGDKLFIYYGGADQTVGVATYNLPEFLEKLLWEKLLSAPPK